MSFGIVLYIVACTIRSIWLFFPSIQEVHHVTLLVRLELAVLVPVIPISVEHVVNLTKAVTHVTLSLLLPLVALTPRPSL